MVIRLPPPTRVPKELQITLAPKMTISCVRSMLIGNAFPSVPVGSGVLGVFQVNLFQQGR